MEKTLWLTFFGHPVVGITAFKSWYIGAMDWIGWIVQCFTSPPTQYRLYGRRSLQVNEHSYSRNKLKMTKTHQLVFPRLS